MSLDLGAAKLARHSPWFLIIALLLGAFGFAAAMAWNDMVKTIVTRYVKPENSVKAMTVYAVTMTILLIVFALGIGFVAPHFFTSIPKD